MSAGDEPAGAEEPWEQEIGALLRALPSVEPPDGFFTAALNHRPLYAGRTMAGLVAVTAATVGLALVLGLSERSLVLPELDAMTQRHLVALTDVASAGETVSPAAVATETELTADFLDSRLADFELTAVVETDELRQSVYRGADGATFSVFVNGGAVDWDGLDPAGLTEIGGTTAWVEEDRQATVVQVGGETVTIVGFPTDEIATLLTDVPDDGQSLADRAQDLVSTVVGQLGYPVS